MLIESDGLFFKFARIGVGFKLFLSDSESDYFLSDLNRIILPHIRFASNSDYTAIPGHRFCMQRNQGWAQISE